MLKRAMFVWAVLPALVIFGFDYIHGIHNISTEDYVTIFFASCVPWTYLLWDYVREA